MAIDMAYVDSWVVKYKVVWGGACRYAWVSLISLSLWQLLVKCHIDSPTISSLKSDFYS